MSNMIRTLNHKLRDKINLIVDEYFELIVKFINKKVVYYDTMKKELLELNTSEKEIQIALTKYWNESFEELKDLFYNMFEDIYKIINEYLKKMYGGDLPEIKIKDLKDLLYNEDGKTFEQRLYDHWYNAKNALDNNTTTDVVKRNLHYNFHKIAVTESRCIESNLKKMKKPITAEVLIIDPGACDGGCPGGIYSVDFDDLPPYHPNCNCIPYYDEADPEEIEELDLEVD